jgi:hypothetical protein
MSLRRGPLWKVGDFENVLRTRGVENVSPTKYGTDSTRGGFDLQRLLGGEQLVCELGETVDG